MSDEFFLDPRVVRRSFDRAARTYDAAGAVQREIRTRLLERLDIVRLAPATVLDLGAGTGHASRELKRRYSSAKVIALDLSLAMLRESARQQSLLRRFAPVCADAHRLPLQERLGRPGPEQPAARVVSRSRRGVRRGRARAAAAGTVHVHDRRARHPERVARALARRRRRHRTCIASSTCTTSATRCCERGSPSRSWTPNA